MPPRRRPPVPVLLLLLLALGSPGEGAVDDTAAAVPGNGTSAPLACSELSRVCTAFIAFTVAGAAANVSVLESMFDTAPGDLTADAIASPGYAFVRKNCSCLASRAYLANTTYTVPYAAAAASPNATVADVAAAAYAGQAVPPPRGPALRAPHPGAVVALHLLCGCSSSPWNYLLSYVGVDGDTVESLSSRYLRDGLATTKGDVYAFGVVLFELISGKEAITRTDGMNEGSNSERHSLASVMLTALRNCRNSMYMGSLKDCIDPNLMDLYPHDCVYTRRPIPSYAPIQGDITLLAAASSYVPARVLVVAMIPAAEVLAPTPAFTIAAEVAAMEAPAPVESSSGGDRTRSWRAGGTQAAMSSGAGLGRRCAQIWRGEGKNGERKEPPGSPPRLTADKDLVDESLCRFPSI
ncbi:hypothetical protein ABZP36_025676 [Zizania latifolia]